MRIDQLRLLAYGGFRGLDLDLSAPGLHVVFGKNEAGKSTTLRAITGLLYGIDHQTNDAYVHAPKDLSIGATLTGGEGERLVIVRRKGTKNTLLDENGAPIEESRLARMLEGVGRDTFKRAFGLDHETLRTGATALLEGRGDLGESLFDASVGGGGDVQRLLAELAQESDKLFKAGGRNPLLNEAIRIYTETKKSIANTERLPQAVRDQEEAIAAASAERDAKTTERSALATKKALLERASRRIPLEKERVRLLEVRAGLGSIAPHVARLDSLKGRASHYERDLRDARDRDAEAAQLAVRKVEAARRAGVADAEEALRLDSKKEARITKLVQERTALEHRLATARAEIGKAERELGRLREIAAKKPADVTRLARAAREAQSLGEAEARLAAAQSKVERRRLELTARAAKLFEPKGKPTLEDMLAIPVPDADALSVLARRADKMEALTDRIETRRADLAKELSRVELSLAENTGALAAPEPADLANARAAREALADFAAYRAAAHATDALADRMIREADRVATVAKLRANEAEYKRQIADATTELARTMTERNAIDVDHAALFAATKIEVRSLSEMRGWLDRHVAIASEIERIRESEAEVAEEARRLASARAELAEALGLEPLFANNKRLAELLDDATTRITTAERERDAVETAARQIAKLEAAHDERATAVATDEVAFEKTCAALAEAIVPLGVDGDASAEEVTRAIEALRDLFKLADEHASVAARAAALAREARAFEQDVKQAVDELAPDLASLSTAEAVASITARGVLAQKTGEDLDRVEAELAAAPPPVLDDALAALAADPDRTAAALESIEEDVARIDQERLKLAQSVGALEAGLADMTRETGAAEQASKAQAALASVRAHAERYARVKLASVILEREIARFREENQGPMLGHASRLFARLTLGHYASVRSGFDDGDKPTLRCVRPDGSTLDVGSLSEGTRDQLYLSLRLASLAMRAPLPLVLDDILVHFDDDRARAALEVLAEASKGMQVLFFTHHARMLDLAASLSPCTFHTLEQRPPPAPTDLRKEA